MSATAPGSTLSTQPAPVNPSPRPSSCTSLEGERGEQQHGASPAPLPLRLDRLRGVQGATTPGGEGEQGRERPAPPLMQTPASLLSPLAFESQGQDQGQGQMQGQGRDQGQGQGQQGQAEQQGQDSGQRQRPYDVLSRQEVLAQVTQASNLCMEEQLPEMWPAAPTSAPQVMLGDSNLHVSSQRISQVSGGGSVRWERCVMGVVCSSHGISAPHVMLGESDIQMLLQRISLPPPATAAVVPTPPPCPHTSVISRDNRSRPSHCCICP